MLSGTFVCFGVLCNLLGFCHQEPTLSQRKPHISVVAIGAADTIASTISDLCTGKRAASDCRAACCQRSRDAAYPELKRLKDDSVSFRSMEVQKFHYCCIRVLQPFPLAGASHAWPTKLLEAQQICFSARWSWASDQRFANADPAVL